MIFNQHFELAGRHAFLSASKKSWINYTDEKVVDVFRNRLDAARGTELHEFAAQAIRLRVKLQGNRTTLAMYVNDCIGFKMVPEQILYYSDNAFGTADAIRFSRNKLMIFDLKTGEIPASIHQLEIYAAFFCLEYGFKPHDIEMLLRIYQNDEMLEFEPAPSDIRDIMEKVIRFDNILEQTKLEVF